MKKTFFFLTSALIIATTYAKATTFNDTPQIVTFSEFSIEKIQEFINSKNSDIIIELKEGSSFPLQFITKTRAFSALLDPNLMFKVDKTCYLRVVNKKCYMSEDLVNWEKARDFMAGESTVQITQSTTKPGFVLETNVLPNTESEEIE